MYFVENNSRKGSRRAIAGSEPDNFRRRAVYQLNIVEILIKGHNGIESIISCKSKDIEVIEVNKSKVFNMANQRKFRPDKT